MRSLPIIERLRFACYGLVAGLFLGLILGWMFHGFVGVLVKLTIVAILLIPLGAAIWFWFRISNRRDDGASPIQEAEWRNGRNAR